MYESPISVYKKLTHDIAKQKDEYICQAIVKVGVDVDKEELIKALAYDREQYHKGFEDGFKHGIKTFVEMLKEHKCSYDLPDYHSFDAVEIEVIDNIFNELVGDADA